MKTTILTFTDDSVSLTINKNGTSREQCYRGCGTLLTSMLNLDYNIISKVVGMYCFSERNLPLYYILDIGIDLRKILDSAVDPHNMKEIFHILKEYHPVFTFLYTEDDWDDIICDLYAEHHDGFISNSSAHENVKKAMELIDASMEIPMRQLYDFYLYLCHCGIMQPSPVDPPILDYSFSKKGLYRPLDFPDYNQYLDSVFHDYLMLPQKTKKQTATYIFSDGQSLAEDDHFRFILSASLMELARRKKAIRKCAICGCYFVPPHRSDTKYCDNACPEDESLTCKEYADKKLAYKRQQSNEFKRVAKKINNDKHRLFVKNPDSEIYLLSKEYFREENKKMAAAFNNGEISADDYKEWLDKMYLRKMLPEAKHYDFERKAPKEPEDT